ncbi:MAG: peroxiredoxin family protein [Chloroflexi bacterium]|nr:peroxiredoxin family protein [Chloroflexota bacterium]
MAMLLIVAVAACSPEPTPEPTAPPVPTPTAEATIGTPDDTGKIPPLAPIFSVASIDGENVRLEDLLGEVPVYLVFIPSTTSELDRTQLKSLQQNIDQFDDFNAEVVVVVADLPTRVIDMRDELSLEFALIADPLHVVANDWQVFDLDNNGESSPASFVFDAHGNLIARLVAAEPGDRPSVSEVLSVIEESLRAGTA